ncbi:hypothetical protein A6A04_17400 [Paramagnetospirillum marisnigri]|uniref:Histidine kinase n=1 Tax=Paramagnetospirillum marisnigri TaxID=1285242 RepID=A0A178MQ13_9PROT|nr:diguanylate cyclase [Paramagnetospirillum marisnigri]OAN50729.1 hypothetical protein A6A04_17400 [Paramagnetospirillum marisnigri]
MSVTDTERGWEPGDQVAGATVTECLHANSRSWVVRAVQSDQRRVVLKLLRTERPSAREIGRFRHEYDLARRLRHPHIVHPQNLDGIGGRLFITMPDEGATSLRHLLRSGPLAQERSLEIALAVLDALRAVHGAHLIHKDVAPGNILITADGVVKLIDFGISSEMESERQALVRPEELEGTLAYMAPEQTGRMNRDVDYRADFYGLGAVLFEMVTGRAPFSFIDAAEAVHAHLARHPPDALSYRTDLLPAVSRIIARLLSKEPESRYQTHESLARDLEACRDALAHGGSLAGFIPGDGDSQRQFHLSGHLYGREAEAEVIANQFEAAATGLSRLLTIGGFSGIGKTALVHQAQRSLLAQRGSFIRGKFNQYGQHIPYGAFIAAMGQRGRQILALPGPARLRWRKRLARGLEGNARLVADAVPELGRVLGETSPVATLGPLESENRFLRTMVLALAALADEAEPLTLFLDDVQWADRASRRLLKELAFDTAMRHVLVVVAYRDNEVPPGHPFAQDLADFAELGERHHHLAVGPLSQADAAAMLADSLACGTGPVLEELAALCHAKTGGNPFFLRRFIEDLYQRNLLRFDAAMQAWTWSTEEIGKQGMADNVVTLMLAQLRRLPEATRETLTTAAMLGAGFDLDSLVTALDWPADEVALSLRPALEARLIYPASSSYRYAARLGQTVSPDAGIAYVFAHDRVQEAAYGLIDVADRPRRHLRIGRLLLSRVPQDEPVPFEVVNHLNAGIAFMIDRHERSRLAEMNSHASHLASAAAAFDLAADYADQALRLLPDSRWRDHPTQVMALHVHGARMAYLAGRTERMNLLVETGLSHAVTPQEKARLLEVRIEAFYTSGQLVETVDLGLEILAMIEVKLPPINGPDDVARMVRELKTDMDAMGLDTLAERPPMLDPASAPQLSIITKMTAAAYIVRPSLVPQLTVLPVRMMMSAGPVAASIPAYSVFGMMCQELLGEYDFASRLGHMSLQLVERHGWHHVFAHTAFTFNTFVRHWRESVAVTLPALMEAHRNGLEFGNLRHAGLSLFIHDYHALLAGVAVPQLTAQFSEHAVILKRIRQPVAREWVEALLEMTVELQQESLPDEPLESARFSARALAETCEKRKDMTGLLFLNAWRCLMHFLAGRFSQASDWGLAAEKLFPGGPGMHVVPWVVFCRAVSELRQTPPLPPEVALADAGRALEHVTRVYEVNPTAFAAKRLILMAEIARFRGEPADAVCALYRQAELAAGGEAGLHLDAGIAAWLHGTFRQEQRLPLVSQTLAEARLHFLHWGAPAIADTVLPVTVETQSLRPGSKSLGGNVVDLASLMKAVETITAETSLMRLLDGLVRVMNENAGARRAVVILADGNGWRLAAETAAEDGTPGTTTGIALDSAGTRVPTGLIRTVLATGQSLLLDDAHLDPEWGSESYVAATQARSLLCAALKRQGQVVGAVFLENDAAAGIFTPERVHFVELLSASIVNAVESARLNDELRTLAANLEQRVTQRTRELRDSEERLRVILDNAPVPMSLTRRSDALIVYVNPPAGLLMGDDVEHMIGAPALDFYADPAERTRLQEAYHAQGTLKDHEVRLRTRDGRILWVLVSMVPVTYNGDPSDLATIVDITARKDLEITLAHMATTDYLTGVANRRQFMTRCEAELARMRRHGTVFSLIMMDIDHFKAVNDRHGHAMGDEVLRLTAKACAEMVRSEDMIGRMGGEEFGILLPETGLTAALALAERLRQAVAALRPPRMGGQDIHLSASFGVAECRGDETIDQLFARADHALYASKDAGRDRVTRAE